jgi:glucose/arabinose dehydrogenase
MSACATGPETVTSPALSPSAAASSNAPVDLPAPVAPSGDPVDIATGLDAPWSIAFLGETALVSERDSGRILEVSADGTVRTVMTVDGVVAGGEGGLLGLAIDQDDQLYVYSTGVDGNRIERFSLSGEPGSLEAGDPETILEGLPGRAPLRLGRRRG